MRPPALQPSVSLSTVLNPFQALLTFKSQPHCLSLAKKMTCLLLLTFVRTEWRGNWKGIQESLQVTQMRKNLKWSIGRIAFYSYSIFQSRMSMQTLSGFSISYDPAQTAQVDYYVRRNLTHIRSYVLVYMYVRQFYIYVYIHTYTYIQAVELQSKSQHTETWSHTA